MFDIIINFFKSPRWKAPILTFIEENCIIFDDEEENKFEFTTVHEEFRRLVEELLGSMMAELGLTDKQFVEACEKASENKD